MKTLDWYIIRQFLINLLILLVVFVGLFVTIDFLVNIDHFVEAAEADQDQFRGYWRAFFYTVFDWYGPLFLLIYTFGSGLLISGAVAFTLANMVRHGELIAVMAGGVSLYRVGAPMLVVGMLLNVCVLPLQEFAVAPLSDRLVRSANHIGSETLRSFPIPYTRDHNGHLITASEYDPGTRVMENVSILLRNNTEADTPDASGTAVGRITARQASWDDELAAWQLIDGYLSRPEDVEGDAPREPQPLERFETNISPDILVARQKSYFVQLLSLQQLNELRGNDALPQGRVANLIHSRFSGIVVKALLLVIVLPFLLLRDPSQLTQRGIKASVFCVGVWAAATLLLHAGVPGLNPVASAWLPVVILLPLSAWMLQSVRT